MADADKTTEAKEVLEVVVRGIFKTWSCQRLPKQNTVQVKHFVLLGFGLSSQSWHRPGFEHI